jgi:hypothetical protein
MGRLDATDLATRPLLRRHRPDDCSAGSAGRKRYLCLGHRGLDKCVDGWHAQDLQGWQANEAVLLARTLEEMLRILERGSVVERQADTFGCCCERDDAG